MKNIVLFIALVACFFSFNIVATAQEDTTRNTKPYNADQWNTIISLAPFVAPDFEGSKNYRVLPIPFIRVSKSNYYAITDGPGITLNIIDDKNLNAGPSIFYKSERDNDARNDLVKNLTTINSSVEMGGFVSYRFDLNNPGEQIELKIRGLFDVGNAHNGYTVNTSLSYGKIIKQKTRLGLSISTTYADNNYNNTYFGVSALDSAISGLSRYTAKAGIKDIGTNINLAYSFDRNWGIIGVFGYTKLLKPAKNSPIIQTSGSTNQFFATIGISYRF